MSTKAIKQNKMGTAPISRLIISMAVPMIISMLVQAFYNMVDSLYVSQLGQDAFNAVSLSFPIQNIMIAIASGTGTGVVTLISKSLGEQNYDKANKFASNGIFLAVCSYILMLIFGVFGVEVFFRSQTNIQGIIDGGIEYLSICTILSFGLFGQIVMERIMQSTGKSALSMWTQLVGAVTNIILDPFFIFGWWFFPELGVAGAAVATVAGQILSMIVGIILHHYLNKEIRIQIKGFKPNGRLILAIYKIGIPSTLTIGIGSVMTFMMNKLLIAIETTATAAAVFGAYFKVQSFFVMPVIGLANSMNPIVGFNYGARNKNRMLGTYRLAIMYAICYMIFATIVFLAIPGVLLKIFNASDVMLKIGIPAFRIVSISFIFAAYGIVTSQFFMACGKSFLALLMSVARQLVVLIPVAYLLGYTLGHEYVWLAIPAGDLASTLMAVYGRLRLKKQIFDKMPEVQDF